MEAGTLFRLKGNSNIYKVVDNPSMMCTACCAYGKQRLCIKMPYCGNKPSMRFERLSPREARKAEKEQKLIEHFES